MRNLMPNPLYWDMTIKQIALSRLAEIDCRNIPNHARLLILEEFEAQAIFKVQQLAHRHITLGKVARAIIKHGGVNEHLTMPPEAGIESYPLAGTPPSEKISL
jgi:hypothetical protein